MLSWHMEVPRLGAELELQLLAYTTATASQEPSPICDLYHSSQQCWILNPLSESRDRNCVLMDARRVCHLLSHNGNSNLVSLQGGTLDTKTCHVMMAEAETGGMQVYAKEC